MEEKWGGKKNMFLVALLYPLFLPCISSYILLYPGHVSSYILAISIQ